VAVQQEGDDCSGKTVSLQKSAAHRAQRIFAKGGMDGESFSRQDCAAARFMR
jgi:hypothetical protein